MKIDNNSYGSLALVFILGFAAIAILWIWVKLLFIVLPITAAILWFCVWQTAFFSVPKRYRKSEDNVVTSVADGRVVFVGRAYEREYLQRDCIQVSVYMNFFDKHANFWPISGRVQYYKYCPGLHLLAFEPKASVKNEHTLVHIKSDSGADVFFKQIAGGFARRIVCYAERTDKAIAAEQCGIIKFGSRIDLFLPLDAQILVSEGQLVRACETEIARL